MNPKKPGPEMPWGDQDKTPQENKDKLYQGKGGEEPDINIDTEAFEQALLEAGGVVVDPETIDVEDNEENE